ncbi:hypothetical protein D1BOALGB6SA_2047 [Olavius sp. associated proteobacterium Delta 1]|nr:hypothetical protein D1BOALGB6SA_2047 [Olavius sp. associated proteobacterium Delta 1]
MSAILKRLQAIFIKLPENLPAQYSGSNYYRFLVTANYGYLSCGIIHSVLIIIFFLIDVTSLAIYNFASTFLWVAVIKINLKGYWKTALTLAYNEVLIHSILCTVSRKQWNMSKPCFPDRYKRERCALIGNLSLRTLSAEMLSGITGSMMTISPSTCLTSAGMVSEQPFYRSRE